MRINNLKKILMLVQATGLSSAALLGQTYPIVVGNNTTADFTDLNYANQEKISEDPAAPAYSVSAVFVGNGSNVSISNSSFTNNYAEVANSSTVSTALVHSAVSESDDHGFGLPRQCFLLGVFVSNVFHRSQR